MPEWNTTDLLTDTDLSDELAVNSGGAWKRIGAEHVKGWQSGAYGEVVIYNPDKPGEYANGLAALAACPTGGCFKLIGDWTTSVSGELALTTSRAIEGSGWAREYVDDLAGGVNIERYGTKIINDGPNTYGIVLEPPVINSNQRMDNAVVRDLMILHTIAAPYAAIYIEDVIYPYIDKIYIECSGVGDVGIDIIGTTFFIECNTLLIREFNTYGIRYRGQGGSNTFNNCHIKSDQVTAIAALYAEAEVTINAGQINCEAGSGVMLRADNKVVHGGRLVGSWFENGQYAVDIEGINTGEWRGFVVERPHFKLDTDDATRLQAGVRFASCHDCHLLNPVGSLILKGALAVFENGADGCSVETTADILATTGITVDVTAGHTPTSCVVKVPEATNAQINAFDIDEPLRVEVGYNSDQNCPVFREGGTWYQFTEASYTP